MFDTQLVAKQSRYGTNQQLPYKSLRSSWSHFNAGLVEILALANNRIRITAFMVHKILRAPMMKRPEALLRWNELGKFQITVLLDSLLTRLHRTMDEVPATTSWHFQ